MGQLLTYSPLAALLAGGGWNDGVQGGARAVSCSIARGVSLRMWALVGRVT